MMLKNIVRILSCVSIMGICNAMDNTDKKDAVENPFPLLIQKVSPGFLQNQQYEAVCKSFEESSAKFKEKCQKAMKLPDFPEQLNDMWVDKLQLLEDACSSLKEKKEIAAIHDKLVDVTEDGFRTASEIAIYSTENSEELKGVLYDFWQHLWQAREITEYIFIMSQENVPSSKIPEICEAFDISVNHIRRFAISEHTKEEEEALKVETLLNQILSAYQYMEFGKAFKTEKNLETMKGILGENSKVGKIMLGAFDSEY
jgi:hypothetical protein